MKEFVPTFPTTYQISCMTIAERHKYILEQLKEVGTVKVIELAEQMKVSLVTIRKDLKVLEDRGTLYRSHGSASLRDMFVNDRSVFEKQQLNFEEKQAIAKKAVEMVTPGEAIIIGSGTTARYFAEALPQEMDLTVLTSALNVALVLMARPNIELIQLGGVVRKNASAVVGPVAEHMISQFACSKLFLGVDGLSLDHGLSTTNLLEAQLNKAMIQSAQKTIILCDSSKISQRGFARICDVKDADVLVTDQHIRASFVRSLEESGISVWLS